MSASNCIHIQLISLRIVATFKAVVVKDVSYFFDIFSIICLKSEPYYSILPIVLDGINNSEAKVFASYSLVNEYFLACKLLLSSINC